MLRKIIYGMLVVIFSFICIAQIDKILGYPIAANSFESILENYGKSNYKNCDGVFINEKNKENLHIYLLNIKKGTSNCIINLLEEDNKDTIEIEYSGGGLKMEALYLSNYINKNNIKVKIKNSCESACTYLLMSSKESSVCNTSMIGFHQTSFDEESLSIMNNVVSILEPLNAYSYNKMKEYGVSTNYLDAIISKTPSDEMYYLNHKTETLMYGFADKIEECK